MCDWCGKARTLIPVEGERLCFPCSDAYLNARFSEGLTIMVDGRLTKLIPGTITPRAWHYRGVTTARGKRRGKRAK
jgi:hypothetical protein